MPSPTLAPKAIRERLQALIYRDHPDRMVHRYDRAISHMLAHHVRLDSTIERLINAGCSKAAESVREQMQFSLLALSDQMALTDDPDILSFSYMEAHLVPFTEVIVRAWSIGSIKNDLDDDSFTNDDSSIQESFHYLSNMLYGSRHPSRRDDTTYWRGMTLLHRIQLDLDSQFETEQEQHDGQRFVEWAGSQQDVAAIVRASVDRGTVNPDYLRDLVPMIREGHALGEGAL